jgi:hypothetical protein
MRSSARRSEKYRKKITPLVLPGQAARYAPTAAERIKLEAIVKNQDVLPMLQFSYIAFAEQLLKIKKTYTGATALNEAKYIAAGWSTRGLDETKLWNIGQALSMGNVVPGPISLYEYYNTNDDGDGAVYGLHWMGQTFTVGTVGPNEDHMITSLKLKMHRLNNPGTVTVSIRAVDGDGKPILPDLSIGTIDGNSLSAVSPGEFYEINMSSYALQANTQYAIAVRAPSGDETNLIRLRADTSSPGYTGGFMTISSNGGSTWGLYPSWDYLFVVWGRSL